MVRNIKEKNNSYKLDLNTIEKPCQGVGSVRTYMERKRSTLLSLECAQNNSENLTEKYISLGKIIYAKPVLSLIQHRHLVSVRQKIPR